MGMGFVKVETTSRLNGDNAPLADQMRRSRMGYIEIAFEKSGPKTKKRYRISELKALLAKARKRVTIF